MMARIGACLLLSLGVPQQKEITYGFTTEHYVIEMTVGFPEPYVGRRLVFYSSLDPRKELYYSGDGGTLGKCLQRFVGAAAIVRYSVRHWNGKRPGQATIRERLTIMAQSHGLPDRPLFSKTQELVNGIGSDIQVFGYDEAGVKKPDRSVHAIRRSKRGGCIDRNSTWMRKRSRSLSWSGSTRSIASASSGPIPRPARSD